MADKSNHKLEELRHKRDQARLGGGLKKQEAIRKTGRGRASVDSRLNGRPKPQRVKRGGIPISFIHQLPLTSLQTPKALCGALMDD